ncbi:hypothetical protein P5G62_017930 [Neobacillus sp. 179-C4.2 HS]|jgi:hypothetical protein|uniref:Uncharacterized protein n=1 Tax=Neobacillus driksii TaxID=3035913 RepID=A0ABV4YVW8_9BACI|nr:hypothetical protein [Neobacillus sp. 179.-C4.2 HS]MDP5192225.1 hypothetical protein [Neobacillus sp. 179.-C4.2 HS]
MNNEQLMKFRLRQMEMETKSTFKKRNKIFLAVEKSVSAIKYLSNIKNRFQ